MVLGCAALWGWQGAFLFAAVLAIAAALLLIVAGSILPRAVATAPAMAAVQGQAKVGLDLLLSGPMLRNLLFFICLAMANGGIQTFSVVALGVLWGTPAAAANIGAVGLPADERRRACCWAASSPTARRTTSGSPPWALPAPRPWRS